MRVSNFIPAAPVERDCIPKQVATEMLASPKAKLSNRLRKNCHAARATLWPIDKGPLRLLNQIGPQVPQRPSDISLRRRASYCYDESRESVSPETKLEQKMRSFSIAKLVQINRRAFSRRLAVQHAFEKIVGDESKWANNLRALLNSKADAFDMLFDASESEINRRMVIARAAQEARMADEKERVAAHEAKWADLIERVSAQAEEIKQVFGGK